MTRRITPAQARDHLLVVEGYTRGQSYAACEALRRRGYLRGDWLTGYSVRWPHLAVAWSRSALTEDRERDRRSRGQIVGVRRVGSAARLRVKWDGGDTRDVWPADLRLV